MQPVKKSGLWWKIIIGIGVVIVLVILVAVWGLANLFKVFEKQLADVIPANINAINVNGSVNVNQPAIATNQAVTNTNSLPAQAGATLSKVLISDVFDAKGSVETGKDTFTASTPEIAVSAYILKAAIGLKVTALMTYLPTNEQVGPVTNNTEINGDIISNFSFTKPTTGWPSGQYNVTVSLPDGQTKAVSFNVPQN